MAINQERMEYTFTWFIEGYSYCLQKHGEPLFSPEFVTSAMQNTSWRLQLYPRGYSIESIGYISLFLQRSYFDTGPLDILLKFELSILGVNGPAAVSKELQFVFKKRDHYGYGCFLNIKELFSGLKASVLPQDTLNVSCRMWINEGIIIKAGQGSARTIIGTDHISFLYVFKKFSKLEINEIRTSKVRHSPDDVRVKSKISLDLTITFEITSTNPHKILSTCKLFLVGASGYLKKCTEEDSRPGDASKDIHTVILSGNHILCSKEEYLQNDELTVLCQCTFSSGVKYMTNEKALHEVPFPIFNKIEIDLENNVGYSVTQQEPACSEAMDDSVTN